MSAAAAPLIPHRKFVTFCTILATLMQALDSTIANVALPYMQGNLSATSDQITWVLTSYVVAAAIMTSPVGWLAARFGRKNFFIICLAGFTITSMLCGFAQNLSQMVVFRLAQGTFGAALVPLSQSIMLDIYTPEERGSAMALWGVGVMVGPILGPTLGGYLTDAFDWRWVFFINLPFGILAIVGLVLFLNETKANSALKFDAIGFAVLSIGIGALQLMLDRGAEQDWFSSTEIIAEAIIGVMGLFLFVVHIATAEAPYIPPRIFSDVNFTTGLLLMFAIGLVLLASSAILAPYVQVMAGYPVWQAGLLMAPRGLGTMASMMIAGKLASRYDPRKLMAFGILLLALSLWDMSLWTPAIDIPRLTLITVIQGFGLGFVFIPLQVVAFATLAPDLRTDATALFSLARNVGSAIGISIMSFMLAYNTQLMHTRIGEGLTPFNRMLQTGGSYLFWNVTTFGGRAALNGEVTRQALAISYSNDFLLMMWISLPTALLLLIMQRPKRPAAKAQGAGPAAAASPAHAVLD